MADMSVADRKIVLAGFHGVFLDLLDLFRGNADTRILNLETQQDTLLVFIETPQTQGHRSGFP